VYYLDMKIVAGLGNPGKEYEHTRHNAGRIVVDLISKRMADTKIKFQLKFLMPDNFMNNSGPAVAKALAGNKMKISFNRSSGGHNGLNSVIKALKSQEFLRIRIGISLATPSGKIRKPKGEKAVLNFLLGEFKKSELDVLKKLSKKIAEAVEMIFTEGKDKAMSLFNN